VVAPLAVCVALKEPQLPLPQVTAQSTPALAGSLTTAAPTVAVPPTLMTEGGASVKEMEMVVMVTVALAVLVGSALAVAVIVTVLPVGTMAGAV
jgi:hypothetical protein